GEDELLPVNKRYPAILQAAGTYLRTPGIKHNGNMASGGLGCLPYHTNAGEMFLARTMREIEPSHIHPPFDQSPYYVRVIGRRPQGTDDFGLAHFLLPFAKLKELEPVHKAPD